MIREFLIITMLILSIIVMFFIVVTTYSAIRYCGMPKFWDQMPKKEKGWFIPFTGLRTRFDAFGHKDFCFPFKVYGSRTSYVISRLMAMYLDYFTINHSRTYAVIYGSKREEV